MVTLTLLLTALSFRLAWRAHQGADTSRYSLIVNGVRLDTYARALYTPLGFVRRAYIVANVIFLGSFPVLQIGLFLAQQLAFSLYLYHTRPFEEPKLNRLEMFNEGMLLLCASSLLVFTDYIEDADTQYTFGWGVAGIMLSTVIINTFIATGDQIMEAWRHLKRFSMRLRARFCKRSTVVLQP